MLEFQKMTNKRYKDENEESQDKYKKTRLKKMHEEEIGIDEEEDPELFYEVERFLKK